MTFFPFRDSRGAIVSMPESYMKALKNRPVRIGYERIGASHLFSGDDIILCAEHSYQRKSYCWQKGVGRWVVHPVCHLCILGNLQMAEAEPITPPDLSP